MNPEQMKETSAQAPIKKVQTDRYGSFVREFTAPALSPVIDRQEVEAPRIPLTPELLKTVVDGIMIEFAPIASAAAAGHFPSYSFLADRVAEKAVKQHNVDACSFTASRVADELYPRLALPMLHLSAPDEEKVKVALMDAVAFGSALGLSMTSAAKAQTIGMEQVAQQSFGQVAGWKNL